MDTAIFISDGGSFTISTMTVEDTIGTASMLLSGSSFITDLIVDNEEDEYLSKKDASRLIKKLEKQMHAAAQSLDFEKAAKSRDGAKKIRENDLLIDV